MARAPTEPPVAELVLTTLAEIPKLPTFRRAGPQDAAELARATFLHGVRVDMGVMAGQLGVSRATIYRWCGSRELLHEKILEQRAQEFSGWARAHAQGEGLERVIDAVRLILAETAKAQPVRRFMEREPKLALRILTRRRGAVQRAITESLVDMLSEGDGPAVTDDLTLRIGEATHLASVLQWAAVAIDELPDTDEIVTVVRRQLIE